jgi:hypothetical protein
MFATAFSEPVICLGDKSSLHFLDFKEEQLTHAMELCGQHHTFVLSHHLLSEDQWQALPGNVFEDVNGDMQPNPVPDDAVKPEAPNAADNVNQRATKAYQLQVFNDEIAGKKVLKKFLVKGAGPINELLLGGPSEIRTLFPPDIYARLCELYNEIDEATITAWTATLDNPHSATDSITKTVGLHAQVHARLAEAGHALRDFDKMTKLKHAFHAFPAVMASIHDYEVAKPLLSDRTSLELSNHLIRQQSVITTGSIGFTANAALTRADVQAMLQTAVADAYQQGLAAGRGTGGGRGNAGGGLGAAGRRGAGGGRGGRFAGRGAPAGAPRRYCYLHGYDGHAGARCFGMANDPTFTAAMMSAASHTVVPGGSDRYL